MASSATAAVRKQGKAAGSPWPRGITGLGSFLSTLSIKLTMAYRNAATSASLSLFSSCFTSKPHFFSASFSIVFFSFLPFLFVFFLCSD